MELSALLLLNLGHMTTCRRCRLHLVLIPTRYFLPYFIHYTYHCIRHCIHCHDGSIRTTEAVLAGWAGNSPYIERQTHSLWRGGQIVFSINQFFTHKMHRTVTVLQLLKGTQVHGHMASEPKSRAPSYLLPQDWSQVARMFHKARLIQSVGIS
jgi:hypothetical protein